MSLDELRKQIDGLDEQIVRLLNERIRVVQAIGESKKESGGEIYVPSRERAVFEKIERLNEGPLPQSSAHAIYREIMSAALALETEMKIGMGVCMAERGYRLCGFVLGRLPFFAARR